MAEITFLAPGSCQLEVTAQGTVGTDTGVDLASVSWTIEQALIAGCRFSPSAGDVHIDRNGVLTIGRSLFDRINQADGDDAIPGQCTLIIRADSTITDNVLDRFKVLVGYPGEGGGGGGGGVDVGNLVTIEVSTELPKPGGYLGDYGGYINEALYNNRPIVVSHRNDISSAASGMTVHTGNVSTSSISFYKATYDSNEVYTSFESIEISATALTVDPPLTGYYYEFVVPEMGENESLFVVCAKAS